MGRHRLSTPPAHLGDFHCIKCALDGRRSKARRITRPERNGNPMSHRQKSLFIHSRNDIYRHISPYMDYERNLLT